MFRLSKWFLLSSFYMDMRVQQALIGNPLEGLRRSGYVPFRDPKTGSESFVCRLGPDFYPRFHLYLKEGDGALTLSLHLDQKQASYHGTDHMHNGEYEGPHITKELERIRGWLLYVTEEIQKKHFADRGNVQEKKKPWWKIWE
jgi:hypothetical protein